ncbi:MAG: CAP domain-containing protein [Cyclobacteriaceae bacterium]
MLKSNLAILFLISGVGCFAQSILRSGSSLTSSEAEEVLVYHNNVRQEVGVGPLEWSRELAGYAQKWADQLAASGCEMNHRPRSGVWKQQHGENLFWGSDADVYTALDACESWYSEKKFYRNAPVGNGNFSQVGHYTQMVWSKTTHVGMAKAVCRDGSVLVVANYDPPGNYLGQKPYP